MFFTRIFLCPLLLLSTAGFPQSAELVRVSEHAKELMAAGKFAEAVPLYRNLVQAIPNNPGLTMNLGLALHMSGDYRDAVPQFERVLKTDPHHLPAALFLGAARLQLGQPALAIAPLQKVVAKEPQNRDARQMLADAYFATENFRESVRQYKQLSDLPPDSATAWYGLGRSYEALSRRAFDRLDRIGRGSAYWLAVVANSRAKQQQYSSAFYLYREALNKMPALPVLHTELANIYRKTGHPDWAATEERKQSSLPAPNCKIERAFCSFQARRYEDVINVTANTNNAEAYYWQVCAYNELALGAYSRLGELPPSREFHEFRAELFRNQRQYREAAQELREALNFAPKNIQIRRDLAISLTLSRDYESARLVLEDLLKEQPDSGEFNYLLGDTLLNLQQAGQAIPLLEKAVTLRPKLLPAHASLGRAYLQAGKASAAIPHIKAALPTDEEGTLHYQLARAYQSTGQQELAQNVLKEYQDIKQSVSAEKAKADQEVTILPP